MIRKYFLSCHRLPIHSVDCVLWCPEVLSFDSLVYYIFFFCCLCFWHHIQETVKSTLSSALDEWLCHLLHWETVSPAPVPQSSLSLSGRGVPFPYTADPFPGGKSRKEQTVMAKEERRPPREEAVSSGHWAALPWTSSWSDEASIPRSAFLGESGSSSFCLCSFCLVFCCGS